MDHEGPYYGSPAIDYNLSVAEAYEQATRFRLQPSRPLEYLLVSLSAPDGWPTFSRPCQDPDLQLQYIPLGLEGLPMASHRNSQEIWVVHNSKISQYTVASIMPRRENESFDNSICVSSAQRSVCMYICVAGLTPLVCPFVRRLQRENRDDTRPVFLSGGDTPTPSTSANEDDLDYRSRRRAPI